MTGIPELGGRAEHITERVEQHKFHEWIGRLLGGGGAGLLHQLQRNGFEFLDFLECRAAGQLAFPECRVFLAFERINLVEQPGRGKTEGRRRFAGRPNVGEPVECVFLRLQAEIVAGTAGLGGFATAEPAPLIANYRLDC